MSNSCKVGSIFVLIFHCRLENPAVFPLGKLMAEQTPVLLQRFCVWTSNFTVDAQIPATSGSPE